MMMYKVSLISTDHSSRIVCSYVCFLSFCFWLPVEGSQGPASPDSLTSVIGSVGLRDVDLREDGSELAAKLVMLLTGDWMLRLPV